MMGSEGYSLPPLRIGRSAPSGDQPLSVHNGSIHTHTPRESTSTTRNISSTSVQADIVRPTSPPLRAPSRTRSAGKKDHRKSSTGPWRTSELLGHARNESVSSLSIRAKDMMGTTSKLSSDVLAEGGVHEEAPPAPVKERGLKRFGSLMRKSK